MNDPLRPNPRNLLAPDISGPNAHRNLQQALSGHGDTGASGLITGSYDRAEFPTGKYVKWETSPGRSELVWMSNEDLAAEAEAAAAVAAAELARTQAYKDVNRSPDRAPMERILEHVRLAPAHHWTKGKLALELALNPTSDGSLLKTEWAALIGRLIKSGALRETKAGEQGRRTRRLAIGTGDARTALARTRRARVAADPAQTPSQGPAEVVLDF